MDYIKFTKDFEAYDDWNRINAAEPVEFNFTNDTLSFEVDDRVNSPSHYTSGKQEVIDIIEDAIKSAPSNVEGLLQGQVLKYLLRIWLKDNPIEDARKAQWYLNRLIDKMH